MEAVRDAWQAHYAQQSGHRWWPNEALVRFLSGKQFDAIVEAGCGNGANLWLLAEHAKAVVGVDSCREALAVAGEYAARRGVAERITFCEGSIFELPVGDGEADLIVDVMTSQHVEWESYPMLLAEYRRALKPGGRLFRYGLTPGTTITGSKLISTSTYDEVRAFPGIGPVAMPTASQLNLALAEADFELAGAEYVTREYRDRTLAAYSVTEAIAR